MASKEDVVLTEEAPVPENKSTVVLEKEERPQEAPVLEKKPLSETMNARILGTGTETLVLGHGFGVDQSIWDKIFPSLVGRYRVVLFDWFFSGTVKDPNLFDPKKYCSYYPYAEDLISLLDEMGLKNVILIGHSMSAMIGCIASVKRPELFEKLVLVLASPRYLNTEDYEGGFDAAAVDGMIASIESDYNLWATSFPHAVVDAKDPASVSRFSEYLLKMRPEIVPSLVRDIYYADYRDVLENVTAPCALVQVEKDIVVPTSVAHFMQEKIGGGKSKMETTLEMIKGVGHFPMLTEHEELLGALGRILGFDLERPE
ncbi:hypothetical protein MLD38_006851 [Melastoma candidum]|uniref:Uncharacterized protein n=1 Tax=Melastoma candidum TaxID=119954 RepID=A0ACB9RTE7_9MYRT|nr:hypothetical protein MLD38_006851 [Melastoma candidum]